MAGVGGRRGAARLRAGRAQGAGQIGRRAGPAGGLWFAEMAGRVAQHVPPAVSGGGSARRAWRVGPDACLDAPGQPHPRESLRQNWQQLSPGFKRFLVPAGVFALGYFSLGFFLVRAHDAGFSLTDVVLLYALFNTTCVVAAPLVGHLGDRVGRSRIVLLGYATYAGLNLWMVFASARWEMVAVFCIYGVFYAIEESQSKAFIADIEPERRATAMGAYNFVAGSLYLPASLVAGALWTVSPSAAFGLAAALSVAAMGVFLRVRPAARLAD